MKKAFYFFIAIALILGIMGCEEEPNPPQITINNGANVVVDKMKIDSLAIPIYVIGESSLNSVKISALYQNGSEHIIRNVMFEGFVEEYEDTIRYSDFPAGFLQFTKFSVSGVLNKGIKRTRSVPITFSNFGQMLPDPEPLEWVRLGINDAQGLEEFGLFWNNNIVEEFASIQKKPETLKLCTLDASVWDEIITEEALWDAVETAGGINAFNKISTVEDKTYNDVLGVKLNSTTYYLLHITYGKVETREGYGKVVTVTGMYKKAVKI